MEIKNNTIYDEKIIKSLVSFTMHKGKYHKLRKKLFFIFSCLLGLIILLFFALTLFLNDIDEAISFVPSVVILIILYFVVGYLLPKLAFKNNKKLLNSNVRYTFNDEDFIITAENNYVNSSETVKYSFLHKVYEMDDYLFLFINMSTAFLLDKSKFESGNLDLLRELLKQKMPPKKYIICK